MNRRCGTSRSRAVRRPKQQMNKLAKEIIEAELEATRKVDEALASMDPRFRPEQSAVVPAVSASELVDVLPEAVPEPTSEVAAQSVSTPVCSL